MDGWAVGGSAGISCLLSPIPCLASSFLLLLPIHQNPPPAWVRTGGWAYSSSAVAHESVVVGLFVGGRGGERGGVIGETYVRGTFFRKKRADPPRFLHPRNSRITSNSNQLSSSNKLRRLLFIFFLSDGSRGAIWAPVSLFSFSLFGRGRAAAVDIKRAAPLIPSLFCP